jgi:hypothetical protein
LPSVQIGFVHEHESGGLGCMYKVARFHRAIVYFDLTRVAGPVTGATLKANTFYSAGSALAGSNLKATNCGMFLMANGADFIGPGVWPLAGIDVTTPVREAQARGDTGITLVLRGWDESFNLDQNICVREYGDFKLDVTYIP